MVKKPFGKESDRIIKGSEADIEAEQFSEAKAKFNFTQLAHELLVTLNRELPNDVPVILCAHSLGGVLTKRVRSYSVWRGQRSAASRTSPRPRSCKFL